MQKREKILAGGLGGTVVLLFLVFPWFESNFIEPLTQLSTEEEAAIARKDERFDQQLALRVKEKQLAVWRQQSLPPDPLNAQRLYQEWLTDLAQLSGFEQIKVTLDRRVAQGSVYVTIPVTLEGRATLQELAQFLERFESVDLLHRIATCDALSSGSEGNPELQVTITAEGISMNSAPERMRLFPQFELDSELRENQTTLKFPVPPVGFPQETPFRVRLGEEFANVTAIEGETWTLQRGVAKTFAARHSGGSAVELFPLKSERVPDANAVEALWSMSVFTKPAPLTRYDPKLASTTPPPAIRGQRWEWKLNVTSWNPAFGNPVYNLLEGPEGVRLDERTGTLSWTVSRDVELGQRSLQIVVWGTASKEGGFTTTLPVRVRDPNRPPVIEQAAPLKFFIGRASQKRIPATDPDGDNRRLKFSLEGAPNGMTIGESDGVISWTPAQSLEAQSLEVRVTVTDADEFPESVTKTIPISLEEDSARFTYLTTTFKRILKDGTEEWEAYLFDRATNKTMMLRQGEQVTLADFEMTIEKIGDDYVLVKRPEGHFRIVFERPLVNMVEVATKPTELAGQSGASTGPNGEPSAILPDSPSPVERGSEQIEPPSTSESPASSDLPTPPSTPPMTPQPGAPGNAPQSASPENAPAPGSSSSSPTEDSDDVQ